MAIPKPQASSDVRDRAAWNAYWAALGLFVITFLAFAAVRGSGITFALAVALPLLAAGIDLVGYSASHERVCAIEVSRHRWLRVITMGGYSARAFLATGIVEIAGAIAIALWIATRR